MTESEHNEQPLATSVKTELRAQIAALKSKVTEWYTDWESNTPMDNPELLSEVQVLKNKMDEHSKLLEQSVEKLSQLEAVNLVFREKAHLLTRWGRNDASFEPTLD